MIATRAKSAGQPLALGLALALALAGSLALCGFRGPALAQQNAVPVRVDPVVSQPLTQTVPVIGRLVARQAGSVAARISGPIAEFRVQVGDRVNAGEVLAVLDSATMEAERDQAEAGLALARAELETKRAEIVLAQQELTRIEGLQKSAAFSQARFDDVRQQVAIAEAGAREAEAAMAAARVDLRLAEIRLGYTRIEAPYDGVVSRRLSEAGAYAREGDALVEMIADESLEVEADVPASRLQGLAKGRSLAGTLDDGTSFTATVRAIVPDENPLTRTRAVRFTPSFPTSGTALANEQSVTLQIPVGAPREVVSVHKDALIRRSDAVIVFVVVDGTAEPREIVVGEAVGARYEVLDGLAVGEQVVVRGNERLQSGMRVRIEGAS